MSILTVPKVNPDVAVVIPPAPEIASAIKAALGAVYIKVAVIYQDGDKVIVFFKQDQDSAAQYIEKVERFKLGRIRRALDGWQVELDPFYWTWWDMNMLRLVITVGV